MDNTELILQELRTINGQIGEMKGQIGEINGQISEMKGQIGEINGQISEMKGQIGEINGRLDRIEEDLAELKEEHAITREGVNTLLNWADDVAVVVKVPLKAAN